MTINISYIVPTFNGEKYIRKSIESIHNENFIHGDEIVVVDDKSTDETIRIIEHLEKEGKINKFIKLEKNNGEGKAKNIAIELSKNLYFFCLDQDNILEKNSINVLRRVAKEYEAIAFGQIHYFQFNVKNVTHKHIFNIEHLNLDEFEKSSINPGFSGNVLYKKSTWKEVGGFEDVTLESWNMMYKILLSGKKVRIMPGTFYFHRYGHSSAYTRASEKANETTLIELAKPSTVEKTLNLSSDQSNYKFNRLRYALSTIIRKIINE